MFLDESGDDTLYSEEEYQANPSLETHCTLTGVVIAENKTDLLQASLRELKEEIWRTNDVILHSVKIRHKKGAFALFHYKPELYETFKARMNEIVQAVEPIIISSSLDKRIWVKKYPRKLSFKDDPYAQAFVYLLERYAHFLRKWPATDDVRGKIILEKRGNQRKNQLLRETYTDFKDQGTQYNTGPCDRLRGSIDFKSKSFNIPGLQLSDYLCFPFYSNHKNPTVPNEHYKFLEQFIYPGDRNKYGHKKWPV